MIHKEAWYRESGSQQLRRLYENFLRATDKGVETPNIDQAWYEFEREFVRNGKPEEALCWVDSLSRFHPESLPVLEVTEGYSTTYGGSRPRERRRIPLKDLVDELARYSNSLEWRVEFSGNPDGYSVHAYNDSGYGIEAEMLWSLPKVSTQLLRKLNKWVMDRVWDI